MGVELREALLVGGLALVVELFADLAANVTQRLTDVELAHGRAPEHGLEQVEVLEVALDDLRDARILDLDRDRGPVRERGAVDLANAGGRYRLVVEALEDLVWRLADLVHEHVQHLRQRHHRRLGLEAAQHLLIGRADVVGHPVVDVGEDLAGLHGQALHVAEDLDRVERGLAVVRELRLVGGLGLAALDRALGQTEREARARPGREARELDGSPQARGWRLVTLGHGLLEAGPARLVSRPAP